MKKLVCFVILYIFQLLGELLLDRHNFNIMTRYINNADNLKLMMNMLKEKSRSIQFEAFHVFKVILTVFNNFKLLSDLLFSNGYDLKF